VTVPDDEHASWVFPIVVVFSLLRGCALLIPSHATSWHGVSKMDMARIGAKRIAYEAFPAWTVDHPSQVCPSANELTRYLNDDHLVDPWGTPFELRCVRDGHDTRLVVRSYGEDRRPGTADDIWSTDE
jgi:hypothetical protein